MLLKISKLTIVVFFSTLFLINIVISDKIEKLEFEVKDIIPD
mgnify:CR=1 FL=1